MPPFVDPNALRKRDIAVLLIALIFLPMWKITTVAKKTKCPSQKDGEMGLLMGWGNERAI
jgi:hypothetical protein